MSHSKRNTSLAFFTSHERSQLKSHWGSQSTRLTRESFLPFASCRLCLLPSRAPVVACATNGDIFCRECAVSNLLAQRKEIKRLEKEAERKKAEEAEADKVDEEEAARRALDEFERVQMGLEVSLGKGKRVVGREGGKVVVEEIEEEGNEAGKRGTKRKFELDEDELLRIAREERGKARKALDEEKNEATRTSLPSFWVPSLTPTTSNTNKPASEKQKLHPTCPGSTATNPHAYSLKTLVTVHFTEEKDPKTGEPTARICPSCRKTLSNSSKAMLAKPCGHVLCKPCVTQFMTPPSHNPHDPHDPHTSSSSSSPSNPSHSPLPPPPLRCYVCAADLSSGRKSSSNPNPKDTNPQNAETVTSIEKDQGKQKEKEHIKPGLVELSTEGTGFAGGGKNMIKRQGVAFQC
ncbi:MAG: hypothetical protein M1819_006650 [Sarea resinae]|nr:MAG: hypothetical protein M1819_006650 [Sarea resinae]